MRVNCLKVRRASSTRRKKAPRGKSRETSSVSHHVYSQLPLYSNRSEVDSCRVLDSETRQLRVSWQKIGTSVLKSERPSFGMTFARLLVLGAEGRRCVTLSLNWLSAQQQQRGRAAGPTLSLQVRSLIGEGNQAYVDNDLPEAIRIMQEVIRIEPRAVAAWSVLAQCYSDTNQQEKALQLRIMGAHLTHDAEEWDRLARQSR